MMKPEPTYFTDPDLHEDNFGETAMESPWLGYDESWRITTHQREAVVAKQFLGDQVFILVTDVVKRVFGVRNTTTGKVLLVPIQRASFGSDQITTRVHLGEYQQSGIPQEHTLLARMLQHPANRTLLFSVEEGIMKRNGNPHHRSIFKPKFDKRGKRI